MLLVCFLAFQEHLGGFSTTRVPGLHLASAGRREARTNKDNASGVVTTYGLSETFVCKTPIDEGRRVSDERHKPWKRSAAPNGWLANIEILEF